MQFFERVLHLSRKQVIYARCAMHAQDNHHSMEQPWLANVPIARKTTSNAFEGFQPRLKVMLSGTPVFIGSSLS